MTENHADERGRQRNRRALLTSSTNLIAKLVTMATSLATVPLTLHYLGSERFGLWITVSSLTALFAFADLGLGSGLLNAVSEANGRDDPVATRRLVASATAMLSGTALLLLMLAVPAIVFFDWSVIFGLTEPRAVSELTPALLVFTVIFLFSVVGSVIHRTQLGLQMGFLNGIVNATGSVLGLGAVLWAIAVGAGLPWLIAGLLGGPLVALLASGWWLFVRKRPDLIPRRGDVDRRAMTRLARMGALFFLQQVTMAFAYASDNLIGARFAGAAAVGEFAIAAKVFSVVSALVSILLGPLWPAYGEAIARGDIGWVRRTLVRSVCTAGALAGVGVLALLLLFEPLTGLWLHRQLAVSTALLAGLAAWSALNTIGISFALFLNGAHVVGEQAVIALVFALLCLAGKVLLVQRFGLTALPWTTTVLYLATVLGPYLLLTPGILRRLSVAR